VAPSELYARLCHAFLVFFFLLSAKLSHLLDLFPRSLHEIEGICVNFLDQVRFFRFDKGRCHGNQFCGKNGQNYLPPLHLSLCQSKTEWDIATSMCTLTAQMMPLGLYRVKISRLWSSFENVRYDTAKKQAYFVQYLRTYWTDFCNIFTMLLHCSQTAPQGHWLMQCCSESE